MSSNRIPTRLKLVAALSVVLLVGAPGCRTEPARDAAAADETARPDTVRQIAGAQYTADTAWQLENVGETAAYVGLTPTRVRDTRFEQRLPANQFIEVDVLAGIRSVPVGDITAVVVNVTAVDAQGAGFLTVWPSDRTRPDVSTLNPSLPGQTVANLATVGVSGQGRISVYSSVETDVIVDLQGVYVERQTSRSGRIVIVPGDRVLDTRLESGAQRFVGGTTRTIDVRGAGVPSDASAVVINLTATETDDGGFVTAWPSGGNRPIASNLNMAGPGATVANAGLITLNDGRFDLFSSTTTHMIVDVTGYMTGPGATNSGEGLFVAVSPTRLTDTRSGGALPRGWTHEVSLAAGDGGIPTDVAAVALNVTATETLAGGFITAWPARTPRSGTSTLNAMEAGATVPNHAVVGVSPTGFALYTDAGGHLLADAFGYWTGTPVAETEGPPQQPPQAPQPQPSPQPQPLPPPGTLINIGESVGPFPQPSQPPATGPHTFMFEGPGGPARWNPCAPINYLVNSTGASPSARALLDDTIRSAAMATGLEFIYRGETTEGLFGDEIPGVDAVIAVIGPGVDSIVFPGAGGIGGGTFMITSNSTPYVWGFAISIETSDRAALHQTLLHEIGHMLGVDHVPARDHVMHGIAYGVTAYAPGDREGLWRVGAAQGCMLGLNSVGDVPTRTISAHSDPDSPYFGDDHIHVHPQGGDHDHDHDHDHGHSHDHDHGPDHSHGE